MPVSSIDAAARICERGNWQVTNLALQKILYLAHMVYMGRYAGQRLVDAQFEAWDYGPVEPKLYHHVRAFGHKPIGDFFFSAKSLNGTAEGAVLDEACKNFLTKRPAELVAITHQPNTAWAKNYVPGVRGIVIPDRDIYDEYRLRTGSQG
ncbi:Panacea domain-containing protein [Mongoliimonas terrestris]|uniref:Panacea domain-containing protein n=1 Tax=Mongoliimonas terrestris TaxID=1709001 RepID=UPI000949749B|nr:Panacea domain-containing protein [Mongoliimonas terrestris]